MIKSTVRVNHTELLQWAWSSREDWVSRKCILTHEFRGGAQAPRALCSKTAEHGQFYEIRTACIKSFDVNHFLSHIGSDGSFKIRRLVSLPWQRSFSAGQMLAKGHSITCLHATQAAGRPPRTSKARLRADKFRHVRRGQDGCSYYAHHRTEPRLGKPWKNARSACGGSIAEGNTDFKRTALCYLRSCKQAFLKSYLRSFWAQQPRVSACKRTQIDPVPLHMLGWYQVESRPRRCIRLASRAESTAHITNNPSLNKPRQFAQLCNKKVDADTLLSESYMPTSSSFAHIQVEGQRGRLNCVPVASAWFQRSLRWR